MRGTQLNDSHRLELRLDGCRFQHYLRLTSAQFSAVESLFICLLFTPFPYNSFFDTAVF